jgi:hypothetical protein
MKVLVLTSEPITARQLREALPGDVDPKDAEVMVVAPALQRSGFKFWLSDADGAIARAEEVRRQTLDELGQEGVPATGDTGESDPVQAIEDALTTFPAARILIFTHGEAYRDDFDEAELQERFGIPIERA